MPLAQPPRWTVTSMYPKVPSYDLVGTVAASRFKAGEARKSIYSLFLFFVLFAIFILHSRESELYRYTLDGKSALAWELPFLRFMGHLSST